MTLTSVGTGLWATSRHSIDTLADSWIAWQATANTTTAWGTANRAVYVPIRVPRRVIVRELAYSSAPTATGNIDIGLYDQGGTRLVSSGSVAKSGSSSETVRDITDTTIGPGLYYLALNNDTTTDTFTMCTETAVVATARGILTEAVGAVTLPATATWAIDNTLAFIPNLSALLITEVT